MSDVRRRRFMTLLGKGAAAAAVWPLRETADVSPVMARLASYMSAAGAHALPDAVVLEAKNHILDTLAAAISGSELPPGIQALKFARTYGGNGGAPILASHPVAGPLEAAILHGAPAPAAETHDKYTAGGPHPGGGRGPAACALGGVPCGDRLPMLRA